MKKNSFTPIENIIAIAKRGGMFILVDDEKRENEGDLIISSSDCNAKNINFMAKYGRGLICLALDATQAKKLNLSLMSPVNQSRNKTAFTVSIEAKKGITTGISAKDRAKTINVAVKKNVNKKEIVSPGHIFPIIAKDGGVLVRAGHTEASVDISKLAKKNNSAVICEIMNEDGTMAKGQELFNFAKKHNLRIGKIEDLISYRLKKEKLIKLKKHSDIKLKNQKFKIKIYENLLDNSEHFALIKGNIKKGIVPRVRVISSNVVQNYLIDQQLPNSFKKTLNYFRKFNNCVLVFINNTNLKSVTETLKNYKNKNPNKKKNKESLIRNYGIGAQIIKDLKIGKIEDLIAYRLKKEKLIKLKKQSDIEVKNQKYKIRIYENLLDGSEHFALIKGNIKKGIVPRVRVISSNVVQNYLINQQLPNSFDKTLNYFKKFNNCVLVFIKDTNLKSVTQTLKDYKNKDFYKKGNDKLIRNYGIGAQIIKDLKIKNMILITKSLKKVIGLEGYDIKISSQELI